MRLHPAALMMTVAATVLLAACGTDDSSTDRAPLTPVEATTAPSVSVEPPDTVLPAPRPDTVMPTPRPAATETPSSPVPAAPPVASDPLQGNGRCLDLDSAPVVEALAGMGDGMFAWRAEAATDAPIGQCPSLLWLVAVGGNSAAAPKHLMFFADGRYLGTGTSEPYAFTSVAGATDSSVTARYRWLTADEAFCCPQGGPADITYTWDGSRIVMQQPLPQEMLASYGEGN